LNFIDQTGQEFAEKQQHNAELVCSSHRHNPFRHMAALLLLSVSVWFACASAALDSSSIERLMRTAVDRARASVSAGVLASLSTSGADSESADVPRSLADLLGVRGGDELSVKQHINVLLVGVAPPRLRFAATLEPWFRQIARALPHVRAPVGVAQTTTEAVVTEPTSLAFNASVSFVEVSPRVAGVLEEAMLRLLRPETRSCGDAADASASADSCSVRTGVLGDPDLAVDRHYVDAPRFSRVLADLLTSLGLDGAFSLVVLNLKSPVDRAHAVYGYRAGFSQSELLELRANAARLSLAQKLPTPRRWRDTAPPQRRTAAAPADPAPFVSMVAESEIWAKRMARTQFNARALRAFERGTSAERASAEALVGRDELARLAQLCEDADADELACVLRAEPAAHESTLALAAEIAALGSADERRYVQQALREGAGAVRADCLVDAWVSHERVAFLDLGAGPFDWGPTVAAAGVKTFDSFPRMPPAAVVAQEVAAAANTSAPTDARFASEADAFAEVSMLAVYRDLHCALGTDRVCAQLAERVAQLQVSPLTSAPFLARAARDVAAAREAGATPSEDEFFSELSHVVLGVGARQLFFPPVSLFPPVLERAVSFHLFVVSDPDQYAQLDELTFDWTRVQGELRALRLPYQTFSFRVTSVDLYDEPKIVAALASSIRTSTLPTLDADGQFRAVPTRYIDAAALQERLLTLHVAGDRRGITVDAARHINLFLFSLGDEMPLLIDKFHQAKAVDDMVVIVQSNVPRFSSRFVCNGGMVDVDLRNPTHATLGALGSLVGGLVPAHIQYEPTRGAASQEWRWAVGARAVVPGGSSLLSRFGQVSRDVALRNAALSVVTESLDRLRAIERDLRHRHLSGVLLALALPSLSELAGDVAAWQAGLLFVTDLVSQMRFEDAALAAIQLRDLMFDAQANVTRLLDVHDGVTCAINSADMRSQMQKSFKHVASVDASPQPAAPTSIVPWRSTASSVLLVLQVSLLLLWGARHAYAVVAFPQTKVKVN